MRGGGRWREVAGIDHVGVGGDLDGCPGPWLVEGLDAADKYPLLTAEVRCEPRAAARRLPASPASQYRARGAERTQARRRR